MGIATIMIQQAVKQKERNSSLNTVFYKKSKNNFTKKLQKMDQKMSMN